jgi:coproporphyrinogen III oxidase-like Fe-S oxidoreductase
LEDIQKYTSIKNAEISMELDPGTFDREKLDDY